MQRTWLCCKMNCSVSLRGTQLLQIPSCSAAATGSRPGTGTGGGCTHPGSISFSIVPTAEGTCLKVEPEIARLRAASGLAGLQGLAGGQAPTAAVGTFQPVPAGAAGAEMELFWGRPSPETAARPLSAPSRGGSQGAVTLRLPGEMLGLTQWTSTEQEGTEIAEVFPGGERLGSHPT